ncbi:MAG TPA: hypothetical protein VGX94_17200 [Terriglobia bacterium]|nr:hypothetical protein [Terriglobia bacterium]
MADKRSENQPSASGPQEQPRKPSLGRIAALGIVLSPLAAGVGRSGWRILLSNIRSGGPRAPRDGPAPGREAAERESLPDASRAASDAVEPEPVPEHPIAPSVPAHLPEGWHRPRPGKIPHPTYAPATVALGIACLLWGLVTTPIISLIGAMLFVIGLAAWIGDLRHER